MPRVYLEETEYWPVYEESYHQDYPYIDLAADELADLRRVHEEFHAWQDRLHVHYTETSPETVFIIGDDAEM